MESRKFELLIQEIRSGDNHLLKKIFEANSFYCINTLVYKYKCSREDAEDIYIDSILNFRDKIISGKLSVVTNLKAYLFTTCKYMWTTRLKKERKVSNAIEEINAAADHEMIVLADEDQSYKQEIISITNEAMLMLPQRCQDLLKAYYFDHSDLGKIAEKFDFASSNVAKVAKSRCFKKLLEQIKKIQHKERVDVIK